MSPQRVLAVVLQQMLEGTTQFEPRSRQEYSTAETKLAFGLEILCCAVHREICGVVDFNPLCRGESYTHHGAISRSGHARSDRKNQRISLQVANPDRIKPLVVDAEWGQKTPGRDGHVAVQDVVELKIVHVGLQIPFKAPPAWRRGQIGLQITTRLKQPVATHGNEQNRVDQRT